MGGQAFANTKSDVPIVVPRMSPDVYQRVVTAVQPKLETLFARVTIPREAPGKADYGDIDFLVEGTRSNNDEDIWETIKTTLDAELHVNRGGAHSFGLPHPDISGAYVQVDVEISPGNGTTDSAELFEWTKFMKGDADLMQIIGVCHRPLGITCNDRGLHLRVQEIEPYNKKKALLFLTRDPVQALKFYGLNASKYAAGFQDENDLFEWVAQGRFFAREVFEQRIEKSNDRQRQNKRGMYRRFVEDFMPAHVAVTNARLWTREQVLQEGLKMFGKHEQYDTMLAEHDAKEAEEALWRDIKALLPLEGSAHSVAVRGLRRWVAFEDGRPFVSSQPLDATPVWTQAFPSEKREDTLRWVAQNWEVVKGLEKKRANEAKHAATSDAGV